MIILGLCGVTLFAVSVAALAIPKDLQITLFRKTWESLNPQQKTDIQNSLDCCGFNKVSRQVLLNGTGCEVGHPSCGTAILFEVLNSFVNVCE